MFFLLTIIVDDSLENVIKEEISALGAKGYTSFRVEGKGQSGVRNDSWSGENVKIETIVHQDILFAILQRLKSSYFDKYPIIAYYHGTSVVRNSHFS